MEKLPCTGFLRLHQIIGRPEVTKEEAEANRLLPRNGRRPVRPRKAITPLIPVSRSTWFAGIKKGIYPKQVNFGYSVAWRVEDIRALLERLSK